MENDFEIIHRIGLSALLLPTISLGSWELLAIHKEADCVWFALAVYPPLKRLGVLSNSAKAASQGGLEAKSGSPVLGLVCSVSMCVRRWIFFCLVCLLRALGVGQSSGLLGDRDSI